LDPDEPAQSVPPETTASRDVSEPAVLKEEVPSKVSSPKPHPLSISFQPPLSNEGTPDVLDDSLKQLDDSIGVGVDVGTVLNAEGMGSLDMSGLAPDGTTFEDVDDLSQIEHPDILLGGKMMEDAMASDPFAPEPA